MKITTFKALTLTNLLFLSQKKTLSPHIEMCTFLCISLSISSFLVWLNSFIKKHSRVWYFVCSLFDTELVHEWYLHSLLGIVWEFSSINSDLIYEWGHRMVLYMQWRTTIHFQLFYSIFSCKSSRYRQIEENSVNNNRRRLVGKNKELENVMATTFGLLSSFKNSFRVPSELVQPF